MNRIFHPLTNPNGYLAAAAAVYAATVMIMHAVKGQGVFDPQVVVAAVTAIAALGARQVVTPVRDPRVPPAP